MTDDNSMSLVNLGTLSKPADTLIKKVSSAIGGIFEPWQIKRVAKAEAESHLLKAKTDIEITDLHRRAMNRFVEEQASQQENMEEITKKALPHLKDESNASRIEDDWVTNFFDKSRIVSDNDMQCLWARVLAGESNLPGTYSKRTVNFLGDFSKIDAKVFESLCRYGWFLGDRFTPLVFNFKDRIYIDYGIDINTLSHLDSIGLIQFNTTRIYSRPGFQKCLAAYYDEQPLTLTTKSENDTFFVGYVILTLVGDELARLCQTSSVDGFFDYVKDKWSKYLPKHQNT